MTGKQIKHYKILNKLGEGGMGVVYKARDTKLNRDVALKFLPPNEDHASESTERFLQEARAVAKINHPNICQIYNIEEQDDESQFIAIEYINGVTLQDKFSRRSGGKNAGPQSASDESKKENDITGKAHLKTVLSYAVQIASGLKAAHEKGIIHRDIKSGNIMVTETGEIKILDFGLAKIAGDQLITKTGSTLGTTAYMSPEQIRGDELDIRSDIWSFGVVLYEMISGKLPFGGDYDHSIIYSILNTDPPSLSDFDKNIPYEIEQIIICCLSKDTDDRYKTAADLLEDLQMTQESYRSGTTTTNKIPGPGLADFKSSEKRKVFITGGLILSIFLFAYLFIHLQQNISGWFFTGPESRFVHLAVLPFTNIGADASRQVFSDGLVETITSNLTQLEQFQNALWVVPAGEIRTNSITSAGQAHKTFGVNYVIAGSLQPIEGRLRLTINLIDSENLRQISSAVIDVDASDVLELHNSSVERLMTMLNLELNPESREVIQEGKTSNAIAFEQYLEGLGYLQRYERLENVNSSIESFNKAIELDPQFALAHAGLAQAFWRKFEFLDEPEWAELAKNQVQNAIELNNKHVQVHVVLGMINTGTGNYDLAVQNFNNALKADPVSAEAYMGLARAYESNGNHQQAEDTYLRSISLKPDYWAGYNSLGAFYLRINKFKEAENQFKRVIELTPDNHRGYMNLGTVYYFTEQLEDARKMYELSLNIEKSFGTSSNLGTLYYIEGRFKESARMYETALEINNSYYLLWGNLASAYYWIPEEREKAKDAYKRAIELALDRMTVNPNNAEILSHIAGYYAMTEDDMIARNYLQQSLEISPDDTYVMYSAGTTFEQLGEREEAIKWLKKAIENGYSKSEILRQPELKELISDSRFEKILQETDQVNN